MLQNSVEAILNHRWTSLLLATVATLTFGVFATNLSFDFVPQAMFRGNDELVNYTQTLYEEFSHDDNVILIVLEATSDRDTLDAAALDWQVAVMQELKRHDAIDRIESLATLIVPRVRLLGGLRTITSPLILQSPADDRTESRVRAILSESTLIHKTLISEDDRLAAIAVFVVGDSQDVDLINRLLADIDAILARRSAPHGYKVHVTGLPAIRADIVKRLRLDQFKIIPLAYLVFVVALAILFRRVSAVLVPLLTVGVGLVWSMGLLGATHQTFTIFTNVLPILLLVVGVSNCVHVISRFAEEGRDEALCNRAAARRTMLAMSTACLLTLGTTAIGFGSLIVARSELLRSFSWHAALGIGLLYASLILVMGPLLTWCRPPAIQANPSRKALSITRIVTAGGNAVVRRPRLAIAFGILVVVTSVWVSRDVSVNSHLIETFDEGDPVIQTMRLVESQLAGFLPLEISLTAAEPGRLEESDVMRRVLALEAFAKESDIVHASHSYASVHEALYLQTRSGDATAAEFLAPNEDAERQLRRGRSLIERHPRAFNYSTLMRADGRRARVMLSATDAGTRDTLVLIDQLNQKIDELFPTDSGVEVRLAGDAYVAAIALDRFIRDLFYSIMGASVAIFLVIGLLFRSIRVGLIATIPNITPLAVTLGYIGLRGYDLNGANVIVFAIALGLAVDDTIHFVARFREEMKTDDDVNAALTRTLQGAGRAIVVTSLLLVVGLSVVWTSDFVPTRRLAELTSVSVVAALLGDLLLLPACVTLFWKRQRR